MAVRLRQLLVRAIITAGLIVGLPAVTFAHANLVRAEPVPNSILTTAPERVSVWFTESLEPQFGALQVLDGSGQRVDEGESFVDDHDSTMLSVRLRPLADGTYTVLWTNVSTVDGHRVRGSFVFAVGEPIQAVSGRTPVEEPLVQFPLEPILRWLSLLGIMIVVGGLFLQRYIVQPLSDRIGRGRSGHAVTELWRQRSQWLVWSAACLFGAASMGQLVAQTVVTFDLSVADVLGRPMFLLLGNTVWGTLWLWRIGLLLLLMGTLWVETRAHAAARPSGRILREAPLAIAGALLLTMSLVSHAAATETIRQAAIFNHFLHLLAATVWIGGLIHLLAGILLIRRHLAGQERKTALAALTARFSILGVVSVVVLGITGLYSAWAQVTVPAAIATPYGRVLLVKVALVAGILALAACNQFGVRPRLPRDDRADGYLTRVTGGEIALGVLILLLTGLLATLEPARQVASRMGLGQEGALHMSERADGVTVDLLLTPGRVGSNRAIVTLRDLDDQPVMDADSVSVQVRYLESDLGNVSVTAAPLENDRYEVSDLTFGLSGLWQVVLTVRRPDARDIRSASRFEVSPAVIDNSAAITPDPRRGRLWWAAEWGLVGSTLVGMGFLLGRNQGSRRALIMIPGVFALATATLLARDLRPHQETSPPSSAAAADVSAADARWNPFLPDQASLDTGRRIYEDHCMICHGLTGHGDGPRSAGTDAVDIIEHVPLHADSEYFQIVATHEARGDLIYSPGPLHDADIWHLVNYLHVFEVDQLLAESYFRQARLQAEQGEFERAIATLNQAIELSPRFVQALQGRGIAALDRGEVARAVADLSRVVELDPEYSSGYLYRAEAFRLGGRWVEAIDDYTRVISLSPTLADAYYGRAVVRAEAGLVDEAMGDLTRYLELVPEAGHRATVEGLIARLESQSGPTADEAGGPAPLRLTDLPGGFAPYPPASLGLVPGSPLAPGMVIQHGFAFTGQDRFELVWGFTTRPMNETQQAVFDERLSRESLIAFIGRGLRAESISDAGALPVLADGTDASVGVTAVFSLAGSEARVRGIAFRRGDLGGMLFDMTSPEETPRIPLADLAQLLAGRLNPSR